MKTILFLLGRYPGYGGIETVTTCLANALVKQYKVIICALRSEQGKELLELLNPRIIYHALPHETAEYDSDNLADFHQLLKTEQVDIVIYQDAYAPNDYLPLSIPKDSGIRLIVAEHNSPNHALRRMRLTLASCPWWKIIPLAAVLYYHGRWVLRSRSRRTALYERCDRYLLLAQSLRREFLQNSYTKNTDKLDAIGNPLSYTPQHINLKEKKKQILFIGQFVHNKGVAILLRIWQKLAAQAPDWSLVLVGDGPTMPEIREYIAQHKLPRVELNGYCSSVREFCKDASILCMCSALEGFPMVLPEAMCSGAVPIAFSSFTAIDDIFTDGVSGYKIPCFDESIYADRLLQLMKDEDLLRQMAKEALEQSEKFALPGITEQWINIFRQIEKEPQP